jgi:ABC transport ATP-binding subunit
MKKETIVVKNLKKSYSSKIVTDNISVTFYSGQIVTLIGHNGAGKTTFLNQLNGLILSDSGSIQINGIDVTNHPNQARELVSSMPQFQVPIKGVTIQEAVECIGALKGMKKSDIQSSSNQLISYLNLEKWRHTTGEKLSGGLQRLTSFAMSVVDTPSIVILDEPTNDVDPYRRMLMWRHLRNLANQGSTIIIVTHNLFEVERYADRYLMIDKGQVKKDVNVSDIQTQRNLRHQVSISILDEDTIVRFSQMDSCKYDNIEKRLTFTVKKEQLKEIVSIIMDLLEEDKIISYDLKLKNLSYDYEEYMNE